MCSFSNLPIGISIENQNIHLSGAILREIRHFQEQEQFIDVVLIAGANSERFSCHRLVLAAYSEFFKALFTSPKYAAQNEFMLREVHGRELQQLLNFCYGKPIQMEFGSELRRLLSVAFLLKFTAAVVACVDYLKGKLGPSTCLGIYLLAEQLDLDELKDQALKFIYANFVMLCETEEFLQLTPEQLRPLIASSQLVVPSEEFVFNSVKHWFSYNTERVMKLRGYAINEDLLRIDLMTEDFLSKNRISIYSTDSDDETPLKIRHSKNNVPRKSTKAELLAVFRIGDKLKFESYCPIVDTWDPIGQIGNGQLLYVAAIAILNNKIIIVGGQADKQTDMVLSFDLEQKTYVQLSSMQTSRTDFGFGILDDLFYAVGGQHEGKTLNTVERYDPVANKWNTVAGMSHRRSGLGVAVLDGCLYAVGGQEYDLGAVEAYEHSIESYCSTECYDPHTNTWTPRAYMNRARSHHGLAAFNGYLYAVGGRAFADLKTVERYDPRENKWTLMCPLNKPERLLSCVALGKSLLSINRETGVVQKYDFEKYKWVQVTQCPESYVGQWHVVAMPI